MISDPTNYLSGVASVGSSLGMTFVHSTDFRQSVVVDDPGVTYWATAPAFANSRVTSGDLSGTDPYGFGEIQLFDSSQSGVTDKIGFYAVDFASSSAYVASWSMQFAAPFDTLSKTDIQGNWMSYLTADQLNNITLTLELYRKTYDGMGYWSWSSADVLAVLKSEPASVRITAIPEPSHLAGLLGLGALVLTAWRRRSRP